MSKSSNILKNLQTPQSFRDHLVIDQKTGATIGELAEPWQQSDFEATDQGWQFAARVISDSPQHQFAYLERPRSHSKTMDVATQVLWTLAASPFKITGIAASGDAEQAKFLRDSIDTLLLLNPTLEKRLRANNFQVKNDATGSTLNVISSDASSSFGWNPDFVVCDEFTHWGKGGADFFDSLVSSAGKRPNSFFVIISNAGRIKDSWQWEVREKARTLESWYFSSLNGPQASWITEDVLKRQRDSLTSLVAYKRLWLNEWTADSGGDHISQVLINEACKMKGPDAKPTGTLIAGLDLGIKRDASAFSVLKVDYEENVIKLVHHKKWLPADSDSKQVSIEEVEKHILNFNEEHELYYLIADNWQAISTCQRLNKWIPCYEISMNANATDLQARTLLHSLQDGSLQIYPDSELVDELGKILIVEMKYNKLKIEAPRDNTGHCDIISSIVVALPDAIAILEDGGVESAGTQETEFIPVSLST